LTTLKSAPSAEFNFWGVSVRIPNSSFIWGFRVGDPDSATVTRSGSHDATLFGFDE
jgi:hypothetical protein